MLGGVDLAMHGGGVGIAGNCSDSSSTANLSNFAQALEDAKFLHSLKNTILFVSGSIIFTLFFSFLLSACIFQMKRKYQGFCLFLLLIPSLAMPGTLASLFYLFFHGKAGALNQFLVIPFGFEPINWMMDPFWILPCLIMQAVWRWVGLLTLLLYCGMRSIPSWQFEVALMEGASKWSNLCHILYPGVRHLLLFGSLFLFIDGVASFSGAYSLLGGSGGVLDAGLLFVSYAYQVAFPGGGGRFDLPLASAMCVMVAGFCTLLGLLVLRLDSGKKTSK